MSGARANKCAMLLLAVAKNLHVISSPDVAWHVSITIDSEEKNPKSLLGSVCILEISL
jgi:hypothetical protein